ncbi:MAG: beta-N-acetylhexosaminidase [Kiritimatiellae bacterium]|nr:beta-N-acetylhexosaminidase [Kiritimatiellia bacterium]
MNSIQKIGIAAGLAAVAVVLQGAAETPFALVPYPQHLKTQAGEFKTPKPAEEVWKAEHDPRLVSEGYRLSITPEGVTCAYADKAGAFYAAQTLAQLRRGKAGAFTYPCVDITDSPKYGWRGVLIDDCRHFFGKEKVKRVMDLMARHKLNRLHWHLTDDQGWRLDIPGYPELAKRASVRAASAKHGTRPHVRMEDYSALLNGETYGPFFYTEADIKEMIAYAAERHITIVPEIELPGHVYAALSAYPELACFPARLKGKGPLCAWGIEKDVLCVGNDKSIKFMEDVLDYVCRLFPGNVVHIGGDECPQVRWKECPKCQDRIKANGLKDEHDLQPWLTRHFLKFLAARGKRAIGWDEYLLGDVPKDAIGMSWRAGGGGAGHKFLTPLECVKRGHDLVMTPRTHCYIDYGQGLADDPFQYIGGRVTLEKCYSFDPCEGIPPELSGHIFGGQGNNWSEYTWNEYDLDWKMWPRTCALAEALWTASPQRDFQEFLKRMETHRKRLVAAGVNCAPLR